MAEIKQEVYVWELPVRIYHWINAICMTILFVTGLYIHSPVTFGLSSEAFYQHTMSTFRWIHFSAAYIFTANFLLRLYWALFGGNNYAKFSGFRPLRPQWWLKPFKRQMKAYLFISKREPHFAGHNPVAAITHFLFIFCGSIFMILSGFAMYSQSNPGGFLDTLFGWMIPLVGSMQTLVGLHQLTAWGFVTYLILHLYAVVRHDLINRTSTTSSIITGYKWEVEELQDK